MQRVQPKTWVVSGKSASRAKSRGGTPQKPQVGMQASMASYGRADCTPLVMRANFSGSGMRVVQSGLPKGRSS